jgi:hypothetical protein
MTKKSLRVALTVAIFGSLSVVCNGQSNTASSGRTYNVDNTRIKVLIPPEMDVAMTPQHLETDSGSAMFYYKLKLPPKDPTRALHWNFYVLDAGGR